MIDVGAGFTLFCTGVLDEDKVGGFIGANPELCGFIGANEELAGGAGGGAAEGGGGRTL